MDLGQNLNQSPLFYRWDGELPGPAPASLSPFVNQLFPSVNVTFHLPTGQSPTERNSKLIMRLCILSINVFYILYNVDSHFAGNRSVPGDDCDILLLPVYFAPFLLCVSPFLPGITEEEGERNFLLKSQSNTELSNVKRGL